MNRPITRADCASVPRPCPFVSCKWHLYLDVRRDGRIVRNFPKLEPSELSESCALDVADEGGASLPQTARLLGVSRQAVCLIQAKAFDRIQTIPRWRAESTRRQRACHFARCGTARRISFAIDLRCDSLDSSLPLWSRENLRLFEDALLQLPMFPGMGS